MIEEQKIEPIFDLFKLVSEQHCPCCSKIKPITAIKVRRVIGFIIISHRISVYKIGCVKCLRIKLLKATIISSLFGWWSIPFGFIHTIYTIFSNINKIIFIKILNTNFLEFLANHRLKLEQIMYDQQELEKFIENSKNEMQTFGL